jgi:hypothetical protein
MSVKSIFILPCLLLGFIITRVSYAQNNEANVWHFGSRCVLDFNFDPPLANCGVSYSNMGASEGSSSISNANGDLLFYSNGIDVYDANNNMFPNFANWPPASIGIPLLGGGQSATNAAFIVPDPGNENEYYLFFAAEEIGYNGLSQQMGLSGISYVKVDMTLNNGMGDLYTDIIVVNETMTEKIAVTSDCSGENYWLVCHKFGTNEFYSYKITASGIEPPVISATGYLHDCPIGQMKISPDGKRIAAATYGFFSLTNTLTLEVLEFDNITGQVGQSIMFDTNFEQVPGVSSTGLYGVAFSMDGSKLYAGLVNDITYGTPSELYQYDLSLPQDQVVANRYVVALTDNFFGSMQLGPDCKLYVANSSGNSISIINDPNEPGVLCNYQYEGVIFFPEEFSASGPNLSLPAFNDALLYRRCLGELAADNVILVSDTCRNDSTKFELLFQDNISDLNWSFGDPQSGLNNSSSSLSPNHIYNNPGVYIVTASYAIDCIGFEISRQVSILPTTSFITQFDFPEVLCLDSIQSVVPELANGFDEGGFFTADNALLIDQNTGIISAGPENEGQYTINYTINAEGCFSDNSFFEFLEIENCATEKVDSIDFSQCNLYVPNTFTPDGDGVNEFLFAVSNCEPVYFSFQLFNRWGDTCFETIDINMPWIGSVDRTFALDGIYHYILKYSFDGVVQNQKTGHVVVVR